MLYFKEEIKFFGSLAKVLSLQKYSSLQVGNYISASHKKEWVYNLQIHKGP